ncbi:ABC-type branched-subunit amino acid transport system substrate-binding protein [Streptomyces canus]|uniref:bifunctional serine/threonine-protein kinase/ABC transporter substrate-binding protein n=1 Tax=Streptomyces canus TaxID=58343 RepID=UPI00278B62D0|nr:bifunctional serine/threonine-protein kinase/ABC transporter substrate-binding protein [Streptomyces canus]MDQ0605053.1 ABC-type branched-subunit amino acid transport system substrate-binding protein [Streptomyces canus]
MQPLRSSDPARIAEHRLLGRLGAGGMGVVYLARTPGGALVALKVLLAEYAEEPGFKERFRREVEVARRVDSRCVVPLVDADPEAQAPWLATTFVPGPSLAEAVTAYGPLSERGVRLLGARLAEALAEVHRAGLIHRDLKPGNVLIAHDGPRLIDFGIARAPEDRTLTATGMVVGTPGYLSPEQAQGRVGDGIGPASDVFSLGCVLAFAATGRAPFGSGAVDALLYRAVHDPADLEGVPAGLLGVLERCLEKDPDLRPDAHELVRELTAGGASQDTGAPSPVPPGERTAETQPRDEAGSAATTRTEKTTETTPAGEEAAPTTPVGAQATEAAPVDAETAEATVGDEAVGWLPEPVTQLIAARSAAALALPDIEHTLVPPDTPAMADRAEPDTRDTTGPSGTREARPVGRRRFLLASGGAAVLAAGGGGAWWVVGRDGSSQEESPASSRRPTHTLALHGDLSGPQKATGRAQERGLRLAVAEFNARRDAPFTVQVKAVDDKGDPTASARVAKELTDDPSVLAVVGPTTDETGQAALATYDAGLLPVVSVSPGTTALSVQGFRSFLHARLPDAVLPLYVSVYLRGAARSRKIGIVVDRPAGTYGTNLASSLSNALNSIPFPSVPEVVSAMRHDFGGAVDTVLSAGADSVFFAGLPDRGALIAATLRGRAFKGPRVSGPALLDERFLTAAQEDAEGWVIVAPVIDATRKPEARAFAAAYRERFKQAPPWYAAEAYDVAGMLLKGLAGLPFQKRTRQNLLTAVRGGKYKGITKTYAFDKTGQLVIDGTGGFLWRVDQGSFVYDGPAPLTV